MKISIIGTGNIAFHLGKRLQQQGVAIEQIIGRDLQKTVWLADILRTSRTINYDNISTESDLYIIAVNDGAIEEVAKKLSPKLRNQFVVHTSGTMPSTILQPFFRSFGTLWPLQTFSIASQPDFERIPIFINSTQQAPPQYADDFLNKFAEKISPRVFVLSDKD